MKNQSKLIRPKQLAEMLDVDLVTIWRWRKKKIMPQPINFGGRLIAWKLSTIENWLSEKENDNDA